MLNSADFFSVQTTYSGPQNYPPTLERALRAGIVFPRVLAALPAGARSNNTTAQCPGRSGLGYYGDDSVPVQIGLPWQLLLLLSHLHIVWRETCWAYV